MSKLDEIAARLNAILDNQNDGLKLSAAIDAFDATVVDDVAYLLAEVKRLEGDVEFTHQWYAERMERLRKLADDNGLTQEYCAIEANGTADGREPPTYAQIMNIAKYRAESAESLALSLAEALEICAKDDPFGYAGERAKAALSDSRLVKIRGK